MGNVVIAVWEAILPTDHQADFGKVSRMYMVVSMWLQKNHSALFVLNESPVDSRKIHAVLAPLVTDADAPPELAEVVRHLSVLIGVPVMA